MKGHDFAGNQARLAKAVLEELPTQLSLYMELRGIKPGPGRRQAANPPASAPPPAYDAAAAIAGGSAPYPSGPSAPYPPAASNPFYPSAP